MEKIERSKLTAQLLLKIGAINFSIHSPYKLSSGFLSPSYIDCRKIIAFPTAFRSVTDMMVDIIKNDLKSKPLDYIIGGETAGIPFAAVIAEKLGFPLSYVRKRAKEYGKNKLIEGEILKDKTSILIEDLMTDGRSKIDFVNKIRSCGIPCNSSLVVFNYDIFSGTEIELKNNNIEVYSLTSWKEVYDQMLSTNQYNYQTMREVKKFLDDPLSWSDNNKNSEA